MRIMNEDMDKTLRSIRAVEANVDVLLMEVRARVAQVAEDRFSVADCGGRGARPALPGEAELKTPVPVDAVVKLVGLVAELLSDARRSETLRQELEARCQQKARAIESCKQ
jgi:hypothetical protein